MKPVWLCDYVSLAKYPIKLVSLCNYGSLAKKIQLNQYDYVTIEV